MFAAIASGNPLHLSKEVPNSNGLQHTIVLSSTKPKSYSHISLFILPNVSFPSEYVATVYFKLNPTEDFKLFGCLSSEKPSAIFKVKLPGLTPATATSGDELGEIDMDSDEFQAGMGSSNISELIIGISIEPRDEGLARLEAWKAEMQAQNTSSLVISKPSIATGINTVGQLASIYPVLTQDLAAKIVQHAYNYLSGFLDINGDVSIKRFDTWWDKFKNRLSNDGSFLDEVTST